MMSTLSQQDDSFAKMSEKFQQTQIGTKQATSSETTTSSLPSDSQQVENQQLILVSTPIGEAKISDWKLETIPTPTEADLQENEYLAQLVWVGVDPYLRNLMKTHPLGSALVSFAVVRVLASKNLAFPKGCHVQGSYAWKRIQIATGAPGERKLDESVPIQTSLGVLGVNGMTAYFGLFEVASLKAGDVVFVSGAAGAVGSLVGQFAKLRGHTVIGSAGGATKCKHVVEDLGFDACIDYKQYNTIENVKQQLAHIAPKGIDVYFDTTGGHITDALFDVLNKSGRVVICGQIAHYNSTDIPTGPCLLHKLIYKSITIRGFTIIDYMSRAQEFYQYIIPLLEKGDIKYREHIVHGFELLPEAFIGLFHGCNIGKTLVQI